MEPGCGMANIYEVSIQGRGTSVNVPLKRIFQEDPCVLAIFVDVVN